MPARNFVVVCALLSVFLPTLLTARAEVVGWETFIPKETYFNSNLAFEVYFVGNLTDLSVQWQPSFANFSQVATVLTACDASHGSCYPPRYLPPPSSPDLVLVDFVPTSSGASSNITTSLLDSSTNSSLAASSASARALLGQTLTLQLATTGHGAYQVSFNAVNRNYTCRWTAQVNNNGTVDKVTVSAPLTLSTAEGSGAWTCVVPNDFDNHLPAGTNFSMEVLLSDGSAEVPPLSGPVVVQTGAVVTDFALPAELCSGQNLTASGFFFMSRQYSCLFNPTNLHSQDIRPASPSLVVCKLPEVADPALVASVSVLEWQSGSVRWVRSFNKTFTFTQTCSSGGGGGGGGDGAPYWVWIIVGVAAVAVLNMALGVALFVYVTRCRQQQVGEYEQLIYADNPVLHPYDDTQLPINKKEFN